MRPMAAITEEGLSRALAAAMAQMWQQMQADAAARGNMGAAAGSTTASPAKLMHKQYAKVEKLAKASDWKE